MARLFGFISNRTDLGPRLLKAKARVLAEHRGAAQRLGWGVGFFQGGELLLRRRPIDERETIDPSRFGEHLKSDLAIGHVRTPTVGNLRTENTHPFRYRHWLFAHTGTLAESEDLRASMAESLPDFLKPNRRGDTDSELLFYMILSALHAGGHLEREASAPASIRAAIREALSLVDSLAAKLGTSAGGGDLLLTDGETLIAAHQSGTLFTYVANTEQECRQLLASQAEHVPNSHLAHARASLIAGPIAAGAAHEEGFRSVPERSLVTLTRSTEPDFEGI